MLHFSDSPHTGGIDSRRRHADGADAGQLPRRRQGSRWRWRKPLRILVHGEGPDGGALERRSRGVGVRRADWSRLGAFLAATASRYRANHGRDRSQQVSHSHSDLVERDQGHTDSPDRCMPTVCTQVDSRATQWWLHAFSWLDEGIYVGAEKLTEEERWIYPPL